MFKSPKNTIKALCASLIVVLSTASTALHAQTSIANVRERINTNIPSNAAKAITAERMREALHNVVDYTSKMTPSLNMAQLRQGKGDSAQVIYVNEPGKSGSFVYNPASSAADDGVMILRSGTKVFERQVEGAVNVLWFGAKGDGVTDNAEAFRKAFNYKNVYVPAGNYRINSSVELKTTVQRIAGEGTLIMGSNADMFFRVFSPAFTNIDSIINSRTALELDAAVKSSYTNIDTKVIAPGHTLAAGQAVVVRGSLSQDFFTEVKQVSGDTVSLSDKLTFTLGSSPKIAAIHAFPLVVQGLTFKFLPGLTTTTGSDIFSLSKTKGVEIRDCKFTGSGIDGGIAISGVGNVVSNCTFEAFRSAILLFDAGENVIERNSITRTGSAIRSVRSHNLRILNNYIANGSDQTHGIGIELTAESGTYDKNCFNKILNNTIINANHGVISSGIGGIHLNFAANHNIIQGNTSKKNTFGIYLENNCDYNTITGNECSYNDGYYGVGIELDWNNDHNTITGNNCSYNVGSLNANESSGIQLRAADATHIQIGNTISGNTCTFNGKEGIRAIGKNVTISGNIIRGNGISKGISMRRGIMVTGENITITGNSIYDDSFDSGSTANFKGRCIELSNATGVIITGNNLYASYYSKGAIYFEATASTDFLNNVLIASNTIKATTANGRAIDIINAAGTAGNVRNLTIRDNIVDSNSNGSPVINLNTVDLYTLHGNTYPGTKTVTLTGSTNRVTPGND